MRTGYDPPGPLELEDLDADPLTQVRRWLEEAEPRSGAMVNAVVLSTVDEHGRPQSRFVLLRGLDAQGLSFFTNYHSAKGRELEARPWAALTFGWLQIPRQVRINGPVTRLPEADSDAYFASRPRSSQIAAWASAQSEPIPDREWLKRRVAEVERRFAGAVPRPPHWGGYRLSPQDIEFWQGGPSRLHDRLRFSRAGPGESWTVQRLSP